MYGMVQSRLTGEDEHVSTGVQRVPSGCGWPLKDRQPEGWTPVGASSVNQTVKLDLPNLNHALEALDFAPACTQNARWDDLVLGAFDSVAEPVWYAVLR